MLVLLARPPSETVSEAPCVSGGNSCIRWRIASRALAIAAGSASGGAVKSGVDGGWTGAVAAVGVGVVGTAGAGAVGGWDPTVGAGAVGGASGAGAGWVPCNSFIFWRKASRAFAIASGSEGGGKSAVAEAVGGGVLTTEEAAAGAGTTAAGAATTAGGGAAEGVGVGGGVDAWAGDGSAGGCRVIFGAGAGEATSVDAG